MSKTLQGHRTELNKTKKDSSANRWCKEDIAKKFNVLHKRHHTSRKVLHIMYSTECSVNGSLLLVNIETGDIMADKLNDLV